MIMLRPRIGKLLSYIEPLIYPARQEITDIRYLHCDGSIRNREQLDPEGWKRFEPHEIWGGHREYYWFDMQVVIPQEYRGQCVVFEILTGKEGGWDATNPQFSCYVNDELRQGFDVNHREVILTESAEGGEAFHILLSAFTGDQNFSLRLEASIKVLDRATERYYYDVKVPYDTACLLDPEDSDYITIIRTLNESLNLLDLRVEDSEAYHKSLAQAQDYLTREFYEKHCDSDRTPMICCIGHTHIDCAWLWTLRVTQDKAVRSFSTVLELMRRYPEYIFMSSQPLLYQYVKRYAPEIYEQIKERVKEGRWEPEGAMFVEPDCNLTSGEALVRQVLYGKRFFKEEFGKDSIVLWLPDVFGYSAALPQILRKSGVQYFMTTKINWNEFNRMPYDTFMWRGIDGTEILTHFMPTRDYKEDNTNANRTNFFTTYNGFLNPSQVKGSWKRYTQKYLNQSTLMACGYGDGGGGTTTWMLENQKRLAQGIPGCPTTRMTTVVEFFRQLEQDVSGDKYLPTWSGELYLEYHRGTYTTMARNKKYNRKSEFAYENIENLAVMNGCLFGGEYPSEMLHHGWEIILKNQFHDILPGSAIKEVYEDSKAEYEEILGAARQWLSEGRAALAEQIAGQAGDVVVMNDCGLPGSGVVVLDGAACMCDAQESGEYKQAAQEQEKQGHDAQECASLQTLKALTDGEVTIPVQQAADGSLVFEVAQVPSRGYRRLRGVYENAGSTAADLAAATGDRSVTSDADAALGADTACQRLVAGTDCMENAFFRLTFNDKGQFASIYDKVNDREVLQAGQAGNVIMSYEDRPHNYDAWDINNYYVEKQWEIDDVESFEVIENGPVRAAVRISRRYLSSHIVQTIYLYANTPRIDIRTEVDWNEHLILLKDLFPIDVHAEEATFEIQYGNVKRPMHSNTMWDFAKFEVCSHKWLDVSEGGYGVSFLNDCKYGSSVKNGVVGLSMLKSSLYPNPAADKEHHEFWYSIYPHSGTWQEADTIQQAYMLNNPMKACRKVSDAGTLAESFSLAAVDVRNVIIEAVKKAEDSDDLVIRMYETSNCRTRTTLRLGITAAQIWDCDMMEQAERQIAENTAEVALEFQPFEIKTVLIKGRL